MSASLSSVPARKRPGLSKMLRCSGSIRPYWAGSPGCRLRQQHKGTLPSISGCMDMRRGSHYSAGSCYNERRVGQCSDVGPRFRVGIRRRGLQQMQDQQPEAANPNNAWDGLALIQLRRQGGAGFQRDGSDYASIWKNGRLSICLILYLAEQCAETAGQQITNVNAAVTSPMHGNSLGSLMAKESREETILA